MNYTVVVVVQPLAQSWRWSYWLFLPREPLLSLTVGGLTSCFRFYCCLLYCYCWAYLRLSAIFCGTRKMSQKSGTETSTVSHYYGMCACVCVGVSLHGLCSLLSLVFFLSCRRFQHFLCCPHHLITLLFNYLLYILIFCIDSHFGIFAICFYCLIMCYLLACSLIFP